jgi:hypothetical protein
MKAMTDDYPYKFGLLRIRIDKQGYDSTGCYFGVGAPVYCYETYEYVPRDECSASICEYLLAQDRDAAKAAIRQTYPNARFYR